MLLVQHSGQRWELEESLVYTVRSCLRKDKSRNNNFKNQHLPWGNVFKKSTLSKEHRLIFLWEGSCCPWRCFVDTRLTELPDTQFGFIPGLFIIITKVLDFICILYFECILHFQALCWSHSPPKLTLYEKLVHGSKAGSHNYRSNCKLNEFFWIPKRTSLYLTSSSLVARTIFPL